MATKNNDWQYFCKTRKIEEWQKTTTVDTIHSSRSVAVVVVVVVVSLFFKIKRWCWCWSRSDRKIGLSDVRLDREYWFASNVFGQEAARRIKMISLYSFKPLSKKYFIETGPTFTALSNNTK
jgi:hypothetical protein